jgi:hypothetical protein
MTIDVYTIIDRKKKTHQLPTERLTHRISDYTLQKAVPIKGNELLLLKNIIPYWIEFSSKKVIFAEVENADALSNSPFITDAIYEKAKKIYCVPFSIFLSLTLEIKSLKAEIILGLHTPRSGSTLLCKIISQAKSVFVMSEPISLNLIERKYSLKDPFAQKLFMGMALFFGHFCNAQEKKYLYIKPYAISNSRAIDELFKLKTKKIITWRGAFETVNSLYKTLPYFPKFFLINFTFFLNKKLLPVQSLDRRVLCENLFNSNKLNSSEVILVYAWVMPMLDLVKEKKDSDVLMLHFDDIRKCEPATLITMILKFLNIAGEVSNKMFLELGQDSQAGTALAKDKKYPLKTRQKKIIEDEVNSFIDLYAHDISLPRTLK